MVAQDDDFPTQDDDLTTQFLSANQAECPKNKRNKILEMEHRQVTKEYGKEADIIGYAS